MSTFALKVVGQIGGGRMVDTRAEGLDYRTPLDWRGRPIEPPKPKISLAPIRELALAQLRAKKERVA